MQIDLSRYRVKLAETAAEREGAQRLRYRVFVEEMGAHATPEEAAVRREWDDFDPYFDHLILLSLDPAISDPLDGVVGVYRLMRGEVALAGAGFYGAAEYDLALIAGSGRLSVELGRSCVAREHRGGPAMHLLWNGLASYVLERKIELLFGVASFHGTDPAPLAEALSFLHHQHLAPPDLRVRAQASHYLDMNLMPREAIDAPRALQAIPTLIKAYLRLGGFVGEGAYVDHDFNTIDVCVVMDTGRMTERYLHFYQRTRGRRVRAGWNEAGPPALPPLTAGERLRLCVRGAWSVAALAVLFAVFLVLRVLDLVAARLAGRSVSALGPRIVRIWAAQALPALGLRYLQNGQPMARGGAFVANHSSWIDIVALQRAAAPFLVSKAEVRGWPVIGHVGRAIGTMFIDRRPAEAKRQEAELRARLVRGDRMAIFPEGTSTDGQRVLPFKSALFGVFFAPELNGNIAVQPVTIVYRPRADLPASFYGWWGEMEFAGHLRDVMARSTGGVVELTFHSPLALADCPDRKALAQAADAVVRRGLERGQDGERGEREIRFSIKG